MHHIFQTFAEQLHDQPDADGVRQVFAEAASAFDLPRFACLLLPQRPRALAQVVGTYPAKWITRYVERRYERLDPVIGQATRMAEPFVWGLDLVSPHLSRPQQQLFDEATEFGIRCGFAIPIHDAGRPVAAITYATGAPGPGLPRVTDRHTEALQLMAMCLHARLRRLLTPDRTVAGVVLSPRQLQCLKWAAEGESAWRSAISSASPSGPPSSTWKAPRPSSACDRSARRWPSSPHPIRPCTEASPANTCEPAQGV